MHQVMLDLETISYSFSIEKNFWSVIFSLQSFYLFLKFPIIIPIYLSMSFQISWEPSSNHPAPPYLLAPVTGQDPGPPEGNCRIDHLYSESFCIISVCISLSEKEKDLKWRMLLGGKRTIGCLKKGKGGYLNSWSNIKSILFPTV